MLKELHLHRCATEHRSVIGYTVYSNWVGNVSCVRIYNYPRDDNVYLRSVRYAQSRSSLCTSTHCNSSVLHLSIAIHKNSESPHLLAQNPTSALQTE